MSRVLLLNLSRYRWKAHNGEGSKWSLVNDNLLRSQTVTLDRGWHFKYCRCCFQIMEPLLAGLDRSQFVIASEMQRSQGFGSMRYKLEVTDCDLQIGGGKSTFCAKKDHVSPFGAATRWASGLAKGVAKLHQQNSRPPDTMRSRILMKELREQYKPYPYRKN